MTIIWLFTFWFAGLSEQRRDHSRNLDRSLREFVYNTSRTQCTKFLHYNAVLFYFYVRYMNLDAQMQNMYVMTVSLKIEQGKHVFITGIPAMRI